MTKISDKAGFAGRYEGEGLVWMVTKFYCGRGIGARWQVEGPYFGAGFLNWAGIEEVVKNWKQNGVEKVA